jgi:hypothetical protein
MTVAHQAPAAILSHLVGMPIEQSCNLGFHRLGEKRSRPVAQNLSQRITESPWLGEMQNVSVGHGVSSFDGKWRLEHPHDTPPHPFMPSPTFEHSSFIVATNSLKLKARQNSRPRENLRCANTGTLNWQHQ